MLGGVEMQEALAGRPECENPPGRAGANTTYDPV